MFGRETFCKCGEKIDEGLAEILDDTKETSYQSLMKQSTSICIGQYIAWFGNGKKEKDGEKDEGTIRSAKKFLMFVL